MASDSGPPTEHRNGVWCWRQCLADDQQKDNECQQDGNGQVDLLARFDWQKEAEKRDGVDEQAREDEVDDVEEAASLHVNGEGDVRIRLVATRVDSLVTFHGNHVHVPLLVLSVIHTDRTRAQLYNTFSLTL